MDPTSIDAAKRQRIENEKLRVLLSDCEEHILRLHQNATAQRRVADLVRCVEKERSALGEYEKNFNSAPLRKFNPQRYISDCAQELSMKELILPTTVPSMEGLGRAMDSLRAMRGSVPAHGAPIGSIMDTIVRYLDKCVTLLKDSKLDSQKWAPMLDPIFMLLFDVSKQRPLNECLTEAEEQCRRLKFEVEELNEKQTQAIMDGDMASAEQLYYTKLSVLEAHTAQQASKIECINEEEVSAFKDPLVRVHEVHKRSSNDVAGLIKQFESLKSAAESDLRKLQTEQERVTTEEFNYTRQFAAARDMSSATLKENYTKQEAAIRKIDEAEKELLQLAVERSEEMKRRMALVEAEARRKVDTQHFIDFAAQHAALLETTIHNCEIAEEVTDTVDEAVSNACKELERHLRQVEHDLECIRQDTHLQNLEGFRGFYLTLGDLLYKKERNVEEVEKKIQMAHMQQELAMETLNPRAKEFSQLKKDLQKVKEEMETQVTSLRDRSSLCIEELKPTEQALRIAGVPFTSPVDELSEKNKARDVKLLEYHELMASESGGNSPSKTGGLNGGVEVVAASDAELAREQQEIERLRASIQPRRPHSKQSPTQSGSSPKSL
eukprot:PhM_4_TR414/c0_g1_i1/m.23470